MRRAYYDRCARRACSVPMGYAFRSPRLCSDCVRRELWRWVVALGGLGVLAATAYAWATAIGAL